MTDGGKICHFSFKAQTRETPRDILRVLEKDFEETRDKSSLGASVEDREFLSQVSSGFHLTEDGHVRMPLPLKRDSTFPNNRSAAEKRLKGLKSRLLKGGKYREDYIEFMEKMLKKGYAEQVDEPEGPEGRTWYLAHHGVYHPRKQKLRIVFDCSSEYQGISLNRCLLQGPDLTNSLTGILCRFRKEPVAVSCDVEGMFNQVSVNVEDRDLLRFLWWEKGDVRQSPKVYRMTTHLFGARSSPACAMYALRSAADGCDEEVSQFIRQDFYIDDGLTSVVDESAAVRLINSVKSACRSRGFHLHKFASNRTEVLHRVDQVEDAAEADHPPRVKLAEVEEQPAQSVLGVQWNTEDDTFSINVHIETVNSLSADAFLNAFRRFVARRGPVSLLRSDRGTNFVGGRNELENAFSEMDKDQLRRGLLHHDCEMTKFEMNVAHASHMGGVWERMIRSARAALDGILRTQCQQSGFDDELLRTFLTEAEAIVNSRPLTCVSLTPSESSEPHPISPMQLLTLKSSVVLPPPGTFLREDVYSRRRWRRVQALADQFWRRWRADFLPTLQQRRRWTRAEPNVRVGDVALIMDDDAPRSQWPLGRVVETHESADGLVRKVTLRVRGNVYDRPIHRLVRLITE